MMLTVRCSSLPRLVACAASGVKPETKIEGPREPSALGTAFHQCMAQIARGEPYDVPTSAAEHHVDAGELAPLVGWAGKLWRERLAELFPSPQIETRSVSNQWKVDGPIIQGTADLISFAGDEIRILDWKSGWVDADATEQLRGYAWLGMLGSSSAQRARVTKLQVRHGTADTLLWTRDELTAWWAWLKQHLADADTFRPGPHCGRCPRALECPAHKKQLAAFIADEPDGWALEPDHLIQTLQLSRLVEAQCKRVQEQIKARVEASGGRLGRLHFKETQPRTVSVARGWDVLSETLGDDVKSALEISNKAIEKAVGDRAAPRCKGKDIAAVYDRLESVGAITRNPRRTLEVDSNDSDSNRQLTTTVGGDRKEN